MHREFPMCESARIGRAPKQVWVWRNLKLRYLTADTADTADHFISSQAKNNNKEEEYSNSAVSALSAVSNKSLEDYSDAA